MISKKHKKTCTALNYVEHLLISVSMVTGCVSIFFCFFNWYSCRYCEFCNWIKNLHKITAWIKKYKPIIKKKRKKYHKIAFLAKTKLNKSEALIYKD